MRKLPISKQLLLTLWKFWVIFQCVWKMFLLETIVKVILIYLLSFIVSEGIRVEPLGPFSEIRDLLILYTPTNNDTDNIMSAFAGSRECPNATVRPMQSETELLGAVEKAFDQQPGNDKIAGVVFEIATNVTLNYTVRIGDNSRVKDHFTWTIEYDRPDWKIFMKTFIAIQSVIENKFIADVTGSTTIQEYPEPFDAIMELSTVHKAILLQRFTSWTGLFICTTLFRSIMEEKESGLKEFQNILGISSTMLWIGRLIDMVIKATLSNIFIGFIMKYVIDYNWAILWLYLTVYSMKAASFLFFMSVFFTKSMTALIVVAILWTTTGNIGKFLVLFAREFTNKFSRLAFAFAFPNVGLALGFYTIAMLEMIETQNDPVTQKAQEVQFLSILGLMLASTVFFLLMTFYLDPIWEHETGGSWKPWPLKKKYRGKSLTPRRSVVDVDYVSTSQTDKAFQAPPMPAHPAVRMRGVSKSYKAGQRRVNVLNNISIDFFTGEVTLVLGENGCGKSTMMGIITGMCVPDHGTVYVQSMDVREEYDLGLIRAQIGWCPQKNIFINCMTIRQLLTFAGKLRGLDAVDNEEQVNHLLDALSIRGVANKKPGGCVHSIARLVCFAFAIMGRPPILLLDEPSAGIDIEGRRLMWNVIKEIRKNRIVVICTNHMDMVDEIADRAIVIKSGKVKCWGSPHYLKSAIGPNGFRLLVERTASANVQLLKSAVMHYFPGAERRSLHAIQIKFLLPRDNIRRLPRLMRTLSRLGARRVSIIPCTMDDVFMRITKPSQDPKRKKRKYILPTTLPCIAYERERDVTWWDQFRALCKKEFLVMKRSWLLYLIGVIVQICIITAIVMVSEWRMFTLPFRQETLSLLMYRGIVLYESGNNVSTLELSYREMTREYQSKVRKVDSIEDEVKSESKNNRLKFNYNYYIGARLHWDDTGDGLQLGTPMYSNVGTFTPIVSINLLNNAILRALGHREARITVNQHPLYQQQFIIVARQMGEGLWGELMVIVLALWLTAFGLTAYEEKVTGSFRLMSLSGAPSIIYWLSRYFCHITLHVLLTCVLLITTITGGINMYSCPSAAGVIFLIWLLYGFAAIPFIYMLTRFLSSVGDVVKALIAVIIATSVFFHFTTVFRTLEYYHRRFFKYILMLLPNYNARVALMKVYELIIGDSACRLRLADECPMGFRNDTYRQRECMIPREYVGPIFEYLVALAWTCVLYLAVVVWWDCKPMWLWRLRRTLARQYAAARRMHRGEEQLLKEDTDVLKERVKAQVAFSRMQKKPRGFRFPTPPPYMMVANEVTLNFVERALSAKRSEKSGHGLSLRLRAGSCMGLLGADRSNRSILLYLLSGQALPTRGDIAGVACRLSEGRKRYMTNVGFAGARDALISQLTVREQIELICSLRGMSLDLFQAKWNVILGLHTIMPRMCGSLSHGRKRLLSVALAMVGEPSVLLLDMPTSIMDPRSRRRVGSAFGEYMRSNKSVIITSNCLADILALCTHVSCVHLGQILCLGTFLYLRERYRVGYAIFFELKNVDEELQELRQVVREEFAGKSKCAQVDRERVHFYIADHEISDDQLVQHLENVMARVPGALSYVVRDRSVIHMLTEGVSQVQSKSGRRSARSV